MTQLSVASQAGVVLVWGDEQVLRLSLTTGEVLATRTYPQLDPRQGDFAVDPAGGRALYGRGQGHGVLVWALDGGEPRTISTDGGTLGAGFSADGRQLLTVAEQKLAQAWDPESGQELGRRRLVGHGDLITGGFSADGQRVLALSYDKLSLFGLEQDGVKPLQRVESDEEDQFRWAELASDASRALVVRESGQVSIWDLSGLRPLGTHSHEGQRCALSQDGRVGVSVAWSAPVDAPYQQELKLWDLPARRELRTLQLETDEVVQVALSPRGDLLLLGHPGPRVEAWDVAQGERRWVYGEAAEADFHPAEPTGRCVLIREREGGEDGEEPNYAGGASVRGLTGWPPCPGCGRAQTLLLSLAADPRKLPLQRHSGLAVFTCLHGCDRVDAYLLQGDAERAAPQTQTPLPRRALVFEPGDDVDEDTLHAPAKLGGAPEWPPRTIRRQTCPECGATLTFRLQLQPGKGPWTEAGVRDLGDFVWVFVCPQECSARALSWSY